MEDRLLPTPQAAEFLGVSPRSMETWRWKGGGPPYLVLGTKMIRYRVSDLLAWAEAPEARACHPREEHLIPLMVAAGAAGADAGRVTWEGTMAGLKISAHRFG